MKADNYKSVALVAREAAAEVMRRDVKDHGEDDSVRRALVDAWRESAERDFLARIGFHLSQGELAAVSVLNGAPYNPRMGGTPPTGAMWLLSPEQEVKALELLGQEAPDTRPVFTTLARPSEVPALLRVLPADTAILTRDDFGGSSGTAIARVGEYVKYLEGILRRQADGIFTVSEAAQVLVDSRPGADIRTMLDKIHKAYRDGKLTVRDPGDMLPKRIADAYRDYLDVVTVADVDSWLDAAGAGYRFPPEWLRATRSMKVPIVDSEGIEVAPPPRPVQRQEAQEAAILAKLVELGYKPEALPTPPTGKPSAAKQAVKAALGYSTDVMNKAWQRLRADDRIKDA